jgi:phage baseplate assembly protein W
VLIREHTLLYEPFSPAAILSILVVSIWATASRRVECRIDLDQVVVKQMSAPKGITSAPEA